MVLFVLLRSCRASCDITWENSLSSLYAIFGFHCCYGVITIFKRSLLKVMFFQVLSLHSVHKYGACVVALGGVRSFKNQVGHRWTSTRHWRHARVLMRGGIAWFPELDGKRGITGVRGLIRGGVVLFAGREWGRPMVLFDNCMVLCEGALHGN